MDENFNIKWIKDNPYMRIGVGLQMIKKRLSVTLTEPYLGVLDRLVEEGI